MDHIGHPKLLELEGAEVLLLATVAQSLALQMPDAWSFLHRSGAKLTFAAAPDGWEGTLARWGRFRAIRASRHPSPRAIRETRTDLDALMSEREWTLIQTQTPIVGALSRTFRNQPGPMVYVAHGFHFHRDGSAVSNLAYETLERILARHTTAIAVVCDEDLESAKRIGLDRNALVWRLPGAGVDLAPFQVGHRRIKSEQEFRLLFVGELNSNKDPLRAVRVAEKIAATRPVRLDIIGEGPLRRETEHALSRSGVTSEVRSRTEDVAAFMRNADVLVAPSRREGLPRVVIEALASGLPVVARSNRGTRELLRGNLGTLLPGSATDTDWAQAVDSATAHYRENDGRRRAELYSTQEFLNSYSELLSQVLEGSA